MKTAPLLFALAVPHTGIACDLLWDYDDSSWIGGFRFYQDGIQVGTAGPLARTISCEEAGLTPGPGPITATAFRGDDESPQSDPAVFDLTAPGLRIIISTP